MHKITYTILSILILLSLVSCGSYTEQAATGSITAKAVWPHERHISNKVIAARAPDEVVTVRMIVSGPGMTSVQGDFAASAGSGVIDKVPVGTGRTVTFQGLDSGGTVIYQGSVNGITVTANQTTDCGTVTMTAVSSSSDDTALPGWTIYSFDTEVSVYGNSIAMDSTDNVHISYHDFTNKDLKYITDTSGSWNMETIDGNGSAGYFSSLALDPSDHVHISYSNDTNGSLKYASNATQNGGWIIMDIDNAGNPSMNSIALELSPVYMHVSYVNSSNELMYARISDDTGFWSSEILDSANASNSIAVDSSDNIHIAYIIADYTAETSSLKYTTNTSGSWIKDTIDSTGFLLCVSMALDSIDNVHVSYMDKSNYTLKYTTNKTGSWVIETVDGSGSVGFYSTSIAVDSSDNVHIVYSDTVNNDLKYVTNAGGSWAIETVDSSNPGMYESITVDSSDNVHISYSSNTGLKYATNAGSPL